MFAKNTLPLLLLLVTAQTSTSAFASDLICSLPHEADTTRLGFNSITYESTANIIKLKKDEIIIDEIEADPDIKIYGARMTFIFFKKSFNFGYESVTAIKKVDEQWGLNTSTVTSFSSGGRMSLGGISTPLVCTESETLKNRIRELEKKYSLEYGLNDPREFLNAALSITSHLSPSAWPNANEQIKKLVLEGNHAALPNIRIRRLESISNSLKNSIAGFDPSSRWHPTEIIINKENWENQSDHNKKLIAFTHCAFITNHSIASVAEMWKSATGETLVFPSDLKNIFEASEWLNQMILK